MVMGLDSGSDVRGFTRTITVVCTVLELCPFEQLMEEAGFS